MNMKDGKQHKDKEELDPEVVWKTNPNPWASWGEDNEISEKEAS